MSLQSNSQPGNKMSACRYLRDGRTSHPRHRFFVDSSSKCISSKMFFTSPNGTSASSNCFSTFFLATHTCVITSLQGSFLYPMNTFYSLSLIFNSTGASGKGNIRARSSNTILICQHKNKLEARVR